MLFVRLDFILIVRSSFKKIRIVSTNKFAGYKIICTFAFPFGGKHIGELAEWSNAAVLKTVDLNGSGGSNPSLSAGII